MDDNRTSAPASPVPTPDSSAQPPELCREIYGMPMFVSIPCRNLTASSALWTEGLGFFELFAIPGQLIHLRRWAFQDVLLIPAEAQPLEASSQPPTVSFACVLDQLDVIAEACRSAGGAVDGPHDRPWNARELAVITPEGTRVVMTAAKPFVHDSPEDHALRAMGICESA